MKKIKNKKTKKSNSENERTSLSNKKIKKRFNWIYLFATIVVPIVISIVLAFPSFAPNITVDSIENHNAKLLNSSFNVCNKGNFFTAKNVQVSHSPYMDVIVDGTNTLKILGEGNIQPENYNSDTPEFAGDIYPHGCKVIKLRPIFFPDIMSRNVQGTISICIYVNAQYVFDFKIKTFHGFTLTSDSNTHKWIPRPCRKN
jgi:hypothetical protein